jgi:RimJ/RimL family protein N-acetyltransferase
LLTWLGERTHRRVGILDAVLAAIGTGAGTTRLVAVDDANDHPRVRRATRYRDEVTVYRDTASPTVVVLGRGLAGRREIAVEVNGEDQRGRGTGTAVLHEALALVPRDEPVFAQVAPGNARSLRAFLGAGYTPIGAEILFSPT